MKENKDNGHSTITDTILGKLQKWYLSQCDGEWEHQFGIKIDTLDNPGWSLEIDINKQLPADFKIPYSLSEKSGHDWHAFKVENGQFSGACGPENLIELLNIFIDLIGKTDDGLHLHSGD